jgi:Chromo (CHRromatin Organisation MOdifier) domain
VNAEQSDWDVHLPMVELAVNSAVQASSGVSPFKMNYGREAALPMDVQLQTRIATEANPAAAELVGRMRQVWKEAGKKLEAAKVRQKRTADKKRSESEFKVGDKVLLSTENIRMIGAAELRRAVKFSAKFIGPFRIVAVVNANAYKLELPEKFSMHSTVNVSRLRRFVDGAAKFPDREVEDWRPTGEKVRDANGEMEFEVEKIIAQRGVRGKRQYLVKWKGYPVYESTWEPVEALENAQKVLRRFHKQVDATEEELTGIFKEVESEAGGNPVKV